MRVAIITPTFERDIRPIIEASAWAGRPQHNPDVQHYIVDNNADHLDIGDPHVVHIKQPSNVGSGKGRNLGMLRAMQDGAEALCFWDDDDVPHPDFLERMSEAIDGTGRSVVACSVKSDGRILPPSHKGTQGRMIRAEAIGNVRWDNVIPGQDRRFWSKFDHLPCAVINDVLMEAGISPQGGMRSERAVYGPT